MLRKAFCVLLCVVDTATSVRTELKQTDDILLSNSNPGVTKPLLPSLDGLHHVSQFSRRESTGAEQACRLFKESFTGIYAELGTSEYTSKIEISWSETCWMQPRCIVTPATTSEVQYIMTQIITSNSTFAVRSGGHSPNPYFSSIDQSGVLIDLSGLDSISISADTKVVSVGPGMRWGDIYEYLAPHGVAVLGGRAPDPGAGGLLLGGGLSLFTSTYGLACDNIKSYELVLGNSTVLNVSAEEYPDLFQRLKGGGPNFGIVTRFELYTVPISTLWFAANVYSPNVTESVISAVLEYAQRAENDTNANLIVTTSSSGTLVEFIYAKPEEWPSVFDPFATLPVMSTRANSTFGTPAQLIQLNSQAAPPTRVDIFGISITYDLDVLLSSYARWKSLMSDSTDRINATMGFTIQVVPTSAVLQGQRKGGNTLGLSTQGQIWLDAVIEWESPKDDAFARSTLADLRNYIAKIAREKKAFLPYIFMNDASSEQNPLAGYGARNLEILKKVAKKYDVGQVFQKLQKGGFLVSRT